MSYQDVCVAKNIMDYDKKQDEFWFSHVNDDVFCEYFMNGVLKEAISILYEDEIITLTKAQSGRLLIQSLIKNDAYGVLDAIANVWSDFEFVKNSYECDIECNQEEETDNNE